MSILDKINSSSDVKKLSEAELEPLCCELREFIIDNVSRTGGHLASNLGAVELSVALHRVYDTKTDRIVFDVGHQSYAHKILTGRRDSFNTLRQHGGISGFPKPHEAQDDAFIAGHASNSVSVALGMARARTLTGGSYDVAAVIGDGALTGGMAYEGLANAAASGEPIVIILNDNNMSISRNVGGTANILEKARVKPEYLSFKRWWRDVIAGNSPKFYSFTHRIKEWLKGWLIPGNVFTEMGLYYLGPVDGHDVRHLETVIRWARDMRQPVIVHVITKKGKGCVYAEAQPDKYHGVGQFDPTTGELKPSCESFSDKFGEYLCKYAKDNRRIVALTAAMCSGTGLTRFSQSYPERFFDVGIAEEHAVAMAAGMAKQGLVPVFAVYSSFLQRGYDMLIHDVSLQNLHVVFAVDRAGLVGSDGETHHGEFDIAYLSTVPNMTVLCPASYAELDAMLDMAINKIPGPVAIRYPRGSEGEYKACNMTDCVIAEGNDVSLVSYGTNINIALRAAELLDKRCISAEVVKISQASPIEGECVFASLAKTGRICVIEDVCEPNCVGQRILARAQEQGISVNAVKLLNMRSGIAPHGSVDELMRDAGLDAQSVAASITQML